MLFEVNRKKWVHTLKCSVSSSSQHKHLIVAPGLSSSCRLLGKQAFSGFFKAQGQVPTATPRQTVASSSAFRLKLTHISHASAWSPPRATSTRPHRRHLCNTAYRKAGASWPLAPFIGVPPVLGSPRAHVSPERRGTSHQGKFFH